VAGERFTAKGREPLTEGWKRVVGVPSGDDATRGDDDESQEDASTIIPALVPGQVIRAATTRTVEKKTKAPPRFTSATLVRAMTGIARFVSNPQIKQLLRETDGIGTPATQAAIIQTLFDRRYIEERKRHVFSTSTGRALIAALPDVATQPDMTALWESVLRKISDGAASLERFLEGVRVQLGELVASAKARGRLHLPETERRPCPAAGCSGTLRHLKGKHGGFWACGRYPECRYSENDPGPSRRTPRSRGRFRRNRANKISSSKQEM
jgi:DNA topoisomerase-3